jgi:putative endonuclease
MRVKDAVGKYGEDLAAGFLADAGLTLVERNWRCSDGEVDIVAREGDTLVFVEVKTRSTTQFGDPAEALTPIKAARIHRLAIRWLAEHREPHDRTWVELRFDVVSIIRLAPGGPSIRHLRAAF